MNTLVLPTLRVSSAIIIGFTANAVSAQLSIACKQLLKKTLSIIVSNCKSPHIV